MRLSVPESNADKRIFPYSLRFALLLSINDRLKVCTCNFRRNICFNTTARAGGKQLFVELTFISTVVQPDMTGEFDWIVLD